MTVYQHKHSSHISNEIIGKGLSSEESEIIDSTLRLLANYGGTLSSAEFLKLIMKHLANSLSVKYALLDKIPHDNPTMAETVVLFAGGEIVENVSYSLEGTPCENVFNRSICCYNSGIQNKFPKDKVLVDWQVESYAGVPLWDSKGNAIGLIAVLDERPFSSPYFIQMLLQIIAVRAGAELERIEIEEQLDLEKMVYKETFKNAGLAIAALNLDGTFQKVNSQFEELLGYSEQQLKQKTFIDITFPDDFLKTEQLTKELRAGTIEVLSVEKRYIRSNGDIITCEVTGSLIKNSNGKGVYSIAILKDITERKIAEEKVLSAMLAAESANRAKTQFLMNMSHELRTPLNAVIGFSDALYMEIYGQINEKQKKVIKNINSSGSLLLRLINDLLDLSKVENGDIDLNIEKVNVKDLIDKAVDMVKQSLPMKEITLHVSEKISEKCKVKADKMRLLQIVINLLSNAVKYNKPDGDVWINAVENKREEVRIIIRDNGRGISFSEQGKIFQPFNRAGKENSGIDGTGIGLTIAKILIGEMGGVINFESKEEEGTMFWIDLPSYVQS